MNTHQNPCGMTSGRLEDSFSERFAAALTLPLQGHTDVYGAPPSTATLPDELCIMILEHVRPSSDYMSWYDCKATMSSLCLVNRTFGEECQSRLFQSLHYSGNTRFARQRGIRVWQDLIKAGDPRAMLLASWVRECTFMDWYRQESAGVNHSVFRDVVLDTAAYFPNLETITLYACPLTTGMPAIFSRMNRVRTVLLEGCTVVDFEREILEDYLPGNYWTSLTVRNIDNLGDLTSVIMHFVNIDELHFLSSDSWDLVSSLLASRPAPKLVDLRILSWKTSRRVLSTLPSALANTPKLFRLYLGEGAPSGGLMLTPSMAPHLEELTAEPLAAARLLCRRPITSLHLLGTNYGSANLSFFQDADVTSRICKLVVPMAALNALSLDAFGALQAITLLSPRCSKLPARPIHCMISSARTVVYSMNHNCCTQCATLTVRLRTQLHQLVTKTLLAWFPNATSITIGTAVEWCRDEQSVELWRPRLIDQSMVRRLLLRNDVRIAQDVSGCLMSVLHAADLSWEVVNRLGYDFMDNLP